MLDQYIHQRFDEAFEGTRSVEGVDTSLDSVKRDALNLEASLEKHEKIFREPDILLQKMFERDRPVHERWCCKDDSEWIKDNLKKYFKMLIVWRLLE